MARKRSVHVYKRGDGRYSTGFTFEGKRYTVYGKTESECRLNLEVKKKEVEQKLAPGSNWTFERYVGWWLETKEPNLSANTLYRIRHFMTKYGFPAWGKIKLRDLTPKCFQDWVNERRRRGKLKASTIRQYFSYLDGPLAYAFKMRMIAFNPCDHVELPKKGEKREKPILTPAQAVELIDKAEGIWKKVFVFTVGTSARRNEVLACRWADINLETREWKVSHNFAFLPGGLVEGGPKTESSNQTIALPRFVLDMLIDHEHDQRKARLRAGENWEDRDLVFCSDMGRPIGDYSFYWALKSTLAKMGITGISPHSLRHGTITWLLDDGEDPREVQRHARHSQLSTTTDTYGNHRMQDRAFRTMARLNDIIESARGDEKQDNLG